MAKQKKIFNYEFDDGMQEIPASYKAKCNITGEFIPIYHKFLESLIKKKYKNNFEYFLKHFTKKGAEEKKRIEEGYDDQNKYSLNRYSDYLIICYKACIGNLDENFNQQSVMETKSKMEHISSCFHKHFNRDITKFV